jgi:fermentation-respiration switch protein FrsA (DUF1100 family)
LPPIQGEGAFTRDAPDVMLTEIHRQAAESAIIRLATMARQGKPIPFGRHDEHVWTRRTRPAAARAAGLRTAFVLRPTGHGPGQSTDTRAEAAWEAVAESLEDLADQLGR